MLEITAEKFGNMFRGEVLERVEYIDGDFCSHTFCFESGIKLMVKSAAYLQNNGLFSKVYRKFPKYYIVA